MVQQNGVQIRPPSVMEDPGAAAVARVYADALLDAAGDSVRDLLEEFASFLDDVIQRNPEFAQLLLTTGQLSREEKIELINRTIGRFGSELLVNFLRVLARHERLDLLPLIFQQCRVQHELRQNKRRVQIHTAVPLGEDVLQAIRNQLKTRFPFDPILIPRVDPSLLGGIIVQVGDTLYDSSLRSRMKQLQNRLRQRSLHEIQSGRNRFSHSEGN